MKRASFLLFALLLMAGVGLTLTGCEEGPGYVGYNGGVYYEDYPDPWFYGGPWIYGGVGYHHWGGGGWHRGVHGHVHVHGHVSHEHHH